MTHRPIHHRLCLILSAAMLAALWGSGVLP